MRTAVAQALAGLPNPVTFPAQDNPLDPVTDGANLSQPGGTSSNVRNPTGLLADPPNVLTDQAPTRPAMLPVAMFLPPAMGPDVNTGIHGTITPGASTPPGQSLPTGDPGRGNSWRLRPDPWDSPLYVANQGAEVATDQD